MDGEELEVNLEELKRLLRTKAYPKGMAEVADAKKQVTAVKQNLSKPKSACRRTASSY